MRAAQALDERAARGRDFDVVPRSADLDHGRRIASGRLTGAVHEGPDRNRLISKGCAPLQGDAEMRRGQRSVDDLGDAAAHAQGDLRLIERGPASAPF